MVRAPCCEKMGLKKGPWTPEEDQTLIAYIQRYGHGNWRALPKQAGLLRCGKSCRLRWTNYLRPDIKRGNFSEEEEETIIKLHDMLGNRWSAIAARLPGRTDNEIKNVWHTHLKKRVKQNQANPDTKMEDESDPHLRFKNPAYTPVYRQQSPSDLSTVTDSSAATSENQTTGIKDEYLDSSETFPEIDESFLLEAISVENSGWPEDSPAVPANPQVHLLPTTEPMCAYGFNMDDGMDFWYNVFIKAGDLPELPEF